MANLKSSKKDVKRSAVKTAVNKSFRTSLKTYVKKVRLAVESGDEAQIASSLKTAYKGLDKAAQRGIIHQNQANRRKSRIATFVAKSKANA